MSDLTSHTYTTAAGTKLHYLQTGTSSGQLLVCLHGLGGSTDTYTPLLAQLKPEIEKYNVVLVDFPGFGKSPLPSKKISVKGHVADVTDLIASFKSASPVILFGHSLGGIVSLHYAAENPDKMAGLVLLGPGRSAGHIPAVKERMEGMAKAVREKGLSTAADGAAASNFAPDSVRKADPSHKAAVHAAVSASDPEGYAQTCEAIVGSDHVDPDYSKIQCPTLFVAGDKDVIAAPERVQDLSKLLGSQAATSVITVASGHQPILEQTAEVAAAVKELLAKTKA